MFISSCRESIHRVSRPILGTIINLTIIADDKNAAQASAIVFDEFERIEALMSPYRKASDISRINNNSGKTVKVTKETFELIEFANKISKQTNGAFDLSFASISPIWNYKNRNFTPPSNELIKEYLPLINYKNIITDTNMSTVKLKMQGMKISAGAIAKGYAIRRGIELLIENKIKNSIVDAGGDLQVIGSKQGVKWKTGLRHPRKDELILTLDMESNESIASSGDYERFAFYKGIRYHHIIDPATGHPTKTFSSVSVISDDPVLSDSYATAIFVMGLKKGIEFANATKNISVILIDREINISISKKLKGKITIDKKYNPKWI